MAGGIGSRFWPISKSSKPKQFLDILNVGRTLLQLTYDRLIKVCPPENIFIVANVEYKDLIKEQLPQLDDNQILCEPQRRNTAPCVAYASYKIAEINPEARCVVNAFSFFKNITYFWKVFFQRIDDAFCRPHENTAVPREITTLQEEFGHF